MTDGDGQTQALRRAQPASDSQLYVDAGTLRKSQPLPTSIFFQKSMKW